MKNKHLLIALLALPGLAMAQTDEEKIKIASHSNKEANAKLALELHQQEDERVARLNAFLAANPNVNPVIKDDESGKVELMDVLPNGEFVYAQTYNDGAATTARAKALYNGGSLGINIQGQGMTAGVWDEGPVRTSHQEFMVGGTSKVQNFNFGANSSHATHVAGTIAAQGIHADARGLAFNASIHSWDWNNDLSEMLNAVTTNGLLVSNHSYGIGSLDQIWFYGAYDARARQMDEIAYNNPYYLPVVSAGNSRNDPDPPASTQISNKNGYDLIFGHANAKNVLTVAAINQMNNYVGLASPQMSLFSSYGPSDDGRIKPEISMKGVSVLSTGVSGDTAYATMNGTSMASPGITGVVTLLQQYHNQVYSNFMRAATVKGLILHTADDGGFTLGPDARFGYGVVNTGRAAEVIRDKALTSNGSVLEEKVLNNAETQTKVFAANGTGQLRVSISWTDPASPTWNTGVTDPAISYLVNDLDVSVTSTATGTVYYPWKLQGMATPNAPATNNSTNDADNYERVDINNPSGEYTVTVTHKGTLVNPQNYTLIITGDNLATLAVRENKLVSAVNVYPNPTTDVLNISGIDKFKATVLDQAGRVILTRESDTKINVSHLASGSYYLVINTADGESTAVKFIKK